MDKILEEDVLAVYKRYLLEEQYIVLSCNAVQGQYYYEYPGGRKFPDIIAVKDDVLLIGEGKIKAKDLFVSQKNVSDYDSIQYLKNNLSILCNFTESIQKRLDLMGEDYNRPLKVKYVFCVGDKFNGMLQQFDKDILLVEVDEPNNKVSYLYGTR